MMPFEIASTTTMEAILQAYRYAADGAAPAPLFVPTCGI